MTKTAYADPDDDGDNIDRRLTGGSDPDTDLWVDTPADGRARAARIVGDERGYSTNDGPSSTRLQDTLNALDPSFKPDNGRALADAVHRRRRRDGRDDLFPRTR